VRERGRVNAGGESDRRKEIEAKPSTERGSRKRKGNRRSDGRTPERRRMRKMGDKKRDRQIETDNERAQREREREEERLASQVGPRASDPIAEER